MDRIDAIKAFIAAVDEGGLSGAAGWLHPSTAAITRTIAYLEDDVGVELLRGPDPSGHGAPGAVAIGNGE